MTCELLRQETDHSVTTHTPTQVTTSAVDRGQIYWFQAAFSDSLEVAEAGNRPFSYDPCSYTKHQRQQLIGSKQISGKFSAIEFLGCRFSAGGHCGNPAISKPDNMTLLKFFWFCGMLFFEPLTVLWVMTGASMYCRWLCDNSSASQTLWLF